MEGLLIAFPEIVVNGPEKEPTVNPNTIELEAAPSGYKEKKDPMKMFQQNL